MKPQIRMTTVDLTKAAEDAGCSPEMETKYGDFDTLQVVAVGARRAAAEAATEAVIAEQRATQAFIRLLRFASGVSNVVEREAAWMQPYRGEDGHILLQSPITSKDVRVAANLAHKQMAKQADQEDLGGMFEGEGQE